MVQNDQDLCQWGTDGQGVVRGAKVGGWAGWKVGVFSEEYDLPLRIIPPQNQ